MVEKVTDYELVLRREPADGPVVGGVLHQLVTGEEFDLDQEAIDAVLQEARERSPRSGPVDGDQLVDGATILRAALDYLGIKVTEEEEEDTDPRPILDRLADAQCGLSSIGEVVDDATVETISDAHDLLTEAARLLDTARDVTDDEPGTAGGDFGQEIDRLLVRIRGDAGAKTRLASDPKPDPVAAAAPEMLAILRQIDAAWQGGHDATALRPSLRAAIANAEGR